MQAISRLTRNHWDFYWPIDGAGLVCVIVYSVLAWFSLHSSLLTIPIYYALLGIGLVATLVAFKGSDEKSLTPMKLILWAACFRLIGVIGDPIWEDDFFRYLWDGYRFYETGSPYGIAPSLFFGDTNIPAKYYALLAQVNYPEVPTIYGPTLQYTFLLAHLLSSAQVWVLQVLYALVDMGMILLLLRLANIRWVLLYAWSPLVIKELAFTAHPDGVGAVLMMLALYYRQQHQLALSVSVLALSVGAKIFALLMVPFILWRLSFRYWCLFSMVLLTLYAPFVWQGGSDMIGLLAFVREWAFNSSVYILLRQWLDPLEVKLILGTGFVLVYAAMLWQHNKASSWKMPRGDIVLGLFLLISPVVNAWYLIWLLPFAVLFPTLWSWTFSVTVLLSYSIGINLNSTEVAFFEMPLWVIVLEYGAVIIAACIDFWLRRKRAIQT